MTRAPAAAGAAPWPPRTLRGEGGPALPPGWLRARSRAVRHRPTPVLPDAAGGLGWARAACTGVPLALAHPLLRLLPPRLSGGPGSAGPGCGAQHGSTATQPPTWQRCRAQPRAGPGASAGTRPPGGDCGKRGPGDPHTHGARKAEGARPAGSRHLPRNLAGPCPQAARRLCWGGRRGRGPPPGHRVPTGSGVTAPQSSCPRSDGRGQPRRQRTRPALSARAAES